MGFIDTHCHLNDESYEDVASIVEECRNQNIEKMICIGFDLPSSIRAVELANTYDIVYAAVGVHPDDADSYNDEVEKQLEALALNNKKVVAIGEIGLDYYWDKASHDTQKSVFAKQIELARRLNLPIIIHNRDAFMDTYEVLNEYAPLRGVMHCYSGSLEMAYNYMKQGLHISFAGPVTFKNAKTPKEVAKEIPLDRILVETDCPYLAPHPHRGKVNYPYFVNLVGKEVASLKGISEEELMEAESRNVRELFGI
ncbi:MAG: TatD family hydrolase [Erysipelotrichales bacterium]|nr:TatD family hydrolase [Erysipelotrichales bacterium]